MSEEAIAINVALLPDQTMVTRAKALNARILQNYPEGFRLDEEHVPHITLLQAFVRRRDLNAIAYKLRAISGGLEADGEVEKKLRAEGFDFYDGGTLGAGGFDVNQPPWLFQAHQQVLSVVAPYATAEGDASAFANSPDDTAGEPTVNYAKSFLDAHAGNNFHPHLSVGIGHTDFLKELCQENFETFSFRIETLAIYQLGNFGTCRRQLFNLGLPSGVK